MNADAPNAKESIVEAAHDVTVAMDDIAERSKHALERIGVATDDAITVVQQQVQVSGELAAAKLKRAARKLKQATRAVKKTATKGLNS